MGNVYIIIKSVGCILEVKIFLKTLPCYVCAVKQKEVESDKRIKRIKSVRIKNKTSFSATWAEQAASCAGRPDEQSLGIPGQKAPSPRNYLGLFPSIFMWLWAQALTCVGKFCQSFHAFITVGHTPFFVVRPGLHPLSHRSQTSVLEHSPNTERKGCSHLRACRRSRVKSNEKVPGFWLCFLVLATHSF